MTNLQYRHTTRHDQPIDREEMERWADAAETAVDVAEAIHAISDDTRTSQAIWEEPTQAEEDHIRMALENYIAAGVARQSEGPWNWGLETISLGGRDE